MSVLSDNKGAGTAAAAAMGTAVDVAAGGVAGQSQWALAGDPSNPSGGAAPAPASSHCGSDRRSQAMAGVDLVGS